MPRRKSARRSPKQRTNKTPGSRRRPANRHAAVSRLRNPGRRTDRTPGPTAPAPAAEEPRFGVYRGVIKDIQDPDGLGRVKVRIDALNQAGARRAGRGGRQSTGYSRWARLVTLMAGPDNGSWFIPDVDDEVLVAFEAGNIEEPYVVGSFWTENNEPPISMDGAASNRFKLIRSRNGLEISMDDKGGQEAITLKTPGGQKIILKDGSSVIEIEDANGNSVRLKSQGIEIQSAAKITVNGTDVTVTASKLTVNTATAKFNGLVMCDTLQANSVDSANYTPGAGNIW